MNCPACQKIMVEQDFGGVKVDLCTDGCKSLWFDWVELIKLDEKHEGAGQALNDALNSSRHRNESRGRLACPKCGVLMSAHFYKNCKVVTVDECYTCGGFFLDSGEIEIIRNNFMSDSDRENYASLLLAQKPEYLAAIAKINEEKEKINPATVARMKAAYKFAGMLSKNFQK